MGCLVMMCMVGLVMGLIIILKMSLKILVEISNALHILLPLGGRLKLEVICPHLYKSPALERKAPGYHEEDEGA